MTVLALLFACQAPGTDPDPVPAEALVAPWLGVNYPWLNYGGDFGENAWGRYGVAVQPECDDDFRRLAEAGVEVVRWFILTDGRASPEFGDGAARGLDSAFWADMDAALALAEAHELWLVPVLLDFHWFDQPSMVDGVQLGGRGAIVEEAQLRDGLLDTVIEPILLRYGQHPNIWAWDIINEPEWAMGHGGLVDGIDPASMVSFVDEVTGLIHLHTRHRATVGSASAAWLAAYWLPSDLDLLQFHYYEALPFAVDATVAPEDVVVGEFATRDVDLAALLTDIEAGDYAGAWPWSYRADDGASGLDLDILAGWERSN